MSSLQKFYFEDLEKSSDKWESYFEVYDTHINKALFRLLEKPRNALTFVEVGVQKGGSLEMWGKFFHDEMTASALPPVNIIGIDVDPECAKHKYEHFPNIEVVIGDQGDPKFWDEFLDRHPTIDIFIDDGGHFMDQQILTFEKVFPRISVGGVYICEDCHTSYMPYNGGGFRKKGTVVDGKKKSATFIEYAKRYVDMIHHEWWEPIENTQCSLKETGKHLTSIHFYDSIIVFEKTGKKEMKRVFPRKYNTTV